MVALRLWPHEPISVVTGAETQRRTNTAVFGRLFVAHMHWNQRENRAVFYSAPVTSTCIFWSPHGYHVTRAKLTVALVERRWFPARITWPLR